MLRCACVVHVAGKEGGERKEVPHSRVMNAEPQMNINMKVAMVQKLRKTGNSRGSGGGATGRK